MIEQDARIAVGSVVQITEAHGRAGWVGAFVLVDEVKSFGVRGYVAHVAKHEEQHRLYIRLTWPEIAYVGEAPLVPEDLIR